MRIKRNFNRKSLEHLKRNHSPFPAKSFLWKLVWNACLWNLFSRFIQQALLSKLNSDALKDTIRYIYVLLLYASICILFVFAYACVRVRTLPLLRYYSHSAGFFSAKFPCILSKIRQQRTQNKKK